MMTECNESEIAFRKISQMTTKALLFHSLCSFNEATMLLLLQSLYYSRLKCNDREDEVERETSLAAVGVY